MATKVKCPMCGKLNDKQDTIKISNRYYCKECAELKQDKQNTDWDLLFQYICSIYNIDKPTGMMFKQLGDYRRDYGYTDYGMYCTLKYYYETLENEVLEGSGLGIIPYYYEKTKQYYKAKADIEDSAEDFVYKEPKKININLEDRNKLIENNNIKLFSFEDERERDIENED